MENKFVATALFTKYMKISDAEDDELFALYLNSAQEIIESYVGYQLAEKEYRHSVTAAQRLSLQGINIRDLRIAGESAEITGQWVNVVKTAQDFEEGAVLPVTYTAGFTADTIPSVFKLTIMRIAALMTSEEGGDIAVTGKSFGSDGGRTFIATRDYSRLLSELDAYRVL